MPESTFKKTNLTMASSSSGSKKTATTTDEATEGQLSLDVYETTTELIIIAPIAGVRMNDINLTVTEDILTIEGERHLGLTIPEDDYLIQECFWGKFSRSIVLPSSVDTTKIAASFKDGVLKIALPRTERTKTKLIKIKAE